MQKNTTVENWKKVKFNFDFTNDFTLEISDLGRMRTFHKSSNGNIINGSNINGYKILRLKFYKPRESKFQKQLNKLQKDAVNATIELRKLKAENATKKNIAEAEKKLVALKTEMHDQLLANEKERTIHYHALIHRLVAAYFLVKPTAKQSIVAHLDFNKQNNKASNLRWMTPEENYVHQQKSPHVIREKKNRKTRPKENSKATKLTAEKVSQLKKLLKENTPVKQLIKQFKITHTQISRISRGENWAEVKPAK